MANSLAFTLALVDKMSAPAKAMATELGGVEEKLKSILELVTKLGSLKLPKLQLGEGGAGMPRSAPAPMGKMFGPSRKDFEMAQRASVKEAERAAKQQSSIEKKMAAMAIREQQLAEKEAERITKQTEQAEIKAARSVAREQEQLAKAPWKGVEQALQPIKLAKGELEQLKQQLRDDKLAVTNLSASLGQLKNATVPNVAAIQAAEKQLQSYKNSLGDTQAKLVASGHAFRFGSEGTNRLTTTLRELAEKAGVLPGTLGGLAQKLGGVAGQAEGMISTLGPGTAVLAGFGVAAVAAAVATVGLGFAIAGLLKKGASLAIEAAEAKGDTLDMLEAMLGTQEAANATYIQLASLTKTTAASQAQLDSSAQALTAAGVTNRDMLFDAVKSIATVESVIKGAGSKIESIVSKAAQTDKFELNPRKLLGTGIQLSVLYAELAKRTGKGVKEVENLLKKGKIKAADGINALSAVIDKKFGALAKKQAMDFGVQMQRLRDNIGKLFADVDTGPFLDGLSRIVDLFDQANPSGKALRDVLKATFDGLFRAADVVIPYVELGLLGLELIALKLLNAFKPVAKQLGLTFGGDALSKQEAMSKTLLLVADGIGKVAGWLGEIMAKKPAIDGLIQGFSLLLAPVIWVAKMLANVTAALFLLGVAVTAAGAWLLGLGQMAVEAGTNFVAGLINGITGSAGRLVESVKSMGTSALNAFKQTFGIASPSKVMMKMGDYLTLGVAAGIDRSAPVANDNMRDMLSVTPPRASEGGRASIGASTQFGAGAVVVNIQVSGDNAQQIATDLAPLMADVFEQAALMNGTKAA